MRFPRWMLLSPVALFAARGVAQTTTLPELKFQDPPNFYRSAIYPPADFSSTEANASLQVYPFRAFTGNVQQAFARTLFRELIDPRYVESNVAPGAKLDAINIPGARLVLRARFNEVVVGLPRERLRMVVVADNAIAIVDAQAISLTSWQRVLQSLNTFASSLHVEAGTPERVYSTPPPDVGRTVAGLYMGFARKYMTDLQHPGYGYYTNALLYYLFSADGRVYRHYDALTVPGNDPSRFDFAGAQRADPVNSGVYTVRGDSIYLKLGSRDRPEKIVTLVPSGGSIQIATVSYKRQ
ncbi:MAG TPA: hypothetical protein VJN70_20805 [Gemmatimonadaceae bacterium]|nr:hypothetical protein [Gemmatimonadaceae bacterium]